MGASDGPRPEHAGRVKTHADPGTRRRPFAKKTRRLPAGHPLWPYTSPRVPITHPGSQLPRGGWLLSGSRTGKRGQESPHWLPEGEEPTFLPPSWSLPWASPGLSSVSLGIDMHMGDVPGCPVAKTSPSNAGGEGLIAGWGSHMPRGQKKKPS